MELIYALLNIKKDLVKKEEMPKSVKNLKNLKNCYQKTRL